MKERRHGRRPALPPPAPFFVLATQNPLSRKAPTLRPTRPLHVQHGWTTLLRRGGQQRQTNHVGRLCVHAVISGDEILAYQQVIRACLWPTWSTTPSTSPRPPPGRDRATAEVNQYLSWGAGPRFPIPHRRRQRRPNGKYNPDIEDVQAVATPILRHRIVRNYKAEVMT